MSTAAAAEAAVPAKKPGKKKLLLIAVLALVLLLVAAGGTAVLLMKRSASAEADDEGDGVATPQAHAATARDPKAVPVFVPLDTFTVNLADRETDRYAQIGISLELDGSKTSDRIKLFMPAIRNNILMVLAHKRASDLLERSGKEQLAAEVLRETERALGIEPPVAGAKPAADTPHPVRAVHFSDFIIQ